MQLQNLAATILAQKFRQINFLPKKFTLNWFDEKNCVSEFLVFPHFCCDFENSFDKKFRENIVQIFTLTLPCGNYGNSLSHIFGKNFVKVTFLLNELLKSWFDEIFFGEIEFSTQCSLLSLHFVNIWKSLPYTQFFSSNQFRVKVDFSFCHSMYLVVCTCTYLLKFLQKCENERLFLLNFFREIVWIYLKVSFTEISSSMVRVKYNFEKQHCENLLPHFLTKISWKQRFYWRCY